MNVGTVPAGRPRPLPPRYKSFRHPTIRYCDAAKRRRITPKGTSAVEPARLWPKCLHDHPKEGLSRREDGKIEEQKLVKFLGGDICSTTIATTNNTTRESQ
jgi:hypothetical protein